MLVVGGWVNRNTRSCRSAFKLLPINPTSGFKHCELCKRDTTCIFGSLNVCSMQYFHWDGRVWTSHVEEHVAGTSSCLLLLRRVYDACDRHRTLFLQPRRREREQPSCHAPFCVTKPNKFGILFCSPCHCTIPSRRIINDTTHDVLLNQFRTSSFHYKLFPSLEKTTSLINYVLMYRTSTVHFFPLCFETQLAADGGTWNGLKMRHEPAAWRAPSRMSGGNKNKKQKQKKKNKFHHRRDYLLSSWCS